MSQRVVRLSGANLVSSHLVIVDPGVEDWRTLVAGLAADAKLVVLDPGRDGVAAIADAVAPLRDLAAIHIVSHGSAGEIDLGSARLCTASLDHYADALACIGRGLKDGGDILLYGCDVAHGAAGHAFVERLADITGADVAAATHAVGASAHGGSWHLDVSIGAITATRPFAPGSLSAFNGLLSPFTFAVNQTSTGTITATATETAPSPAPGDDVTVNSGITVESTGGDVIFQAGDNVVLQSGSLVKSDLGAVTLTAGFSDNDNAGDIALAGTVSAATTVTLSAGVGAITRSSGTLNGSAVALSAANGIGSAGGAGAINTDAISFSATNTTSGNIVVVEASGLDLAGITNNASGGNISVSTVNGSMTTSSAITATGAGGITLAVGGAGSTLTVSNAITTGSGTVDLTADDMALSGTIDAGTGAVTLEPTTAGQQIDLGTETSGKLSLTDAELDTITAGTLTIGSSSAGNITVSAAIAPAGASNLALVSGGSATLAADLSVGTGSLSLNALNGISQTAGAITAGSVDAVALAGSVTLNSATNAFGTITGVGNGGFTAISSQSLSTGFGGVLSGLGDISLTTLGTGSDLTVAFEGAIAANIGGLTLTSSGNLILNDTVSAASLNLNTGVGGETDINVALGDVGDELGSLTTDSNGTTHLNGESVTTSGAQTYHDAVTLGVATTLTSTGSGAITFDTTVDNGGFNLNVSTGGSATFGGVISGTGKFIQEGVGTTHLAATNNYTGNTDINGGTLLVDGSIATSSLTTVASGGTLGGHGTTGAVTVNSGGHLAPGDSQGILTTGDLTLSSGSTFDAEIGGTSPGSYDQVQVHGGVNLGGATLNTSTFGSFFINGQETDNFTIIDNDGNADAVTGTFAGLAEGATLSIGSGTFVITYQGGDGNDVVLLAANNPPSLEGLGDSGDTPSFTENGVPTALDTNQNATVGDAELDVENVYAGATLTLSRHGGANPDDFFTGSGSLDLTDADVSLDNGTTIIGTFSQPGDGTFTITFNGNATAAKVDQVMQQLAYSTLSENPPTSVVIDFTFSDGNGQPGGQDQGPGPAPGTTTGSVTVQIDQVDDAPLLIGVAPAAAYGIGTAGAVLSPALGVFDVDGTPPSTLTGIAGATIQIASGLLAGDQLFVNLVDDGSGHFVVEGPSGPVASSISVQSNASGTLVLVGQDTFANWQQVLDRVSYMSTSGDPTNGGADSHRTITWTVNDGQLNSQTPNTDPDNLVNATILRFAAPPVLDLDASGAGSGFATSYTENAAPVAIVDSDLSLSDPDTTTMTSARIVLTNAKAGDSLSVAGALPGGISSFVDTTAAGQITLQLFNFASIDDYKTALGQIRFANTSENPDSSSRDITVVMSDGEVNSNVAHAILHVVPVNDAPVAQNGSASGNEDTIINGTLAASDVDSTSLTFSRVAQAAHGSVTVNADGTFSYTPNPDFNGTDSFTFKANDGSLDSSPATMTLTVDPVNDAPVVTGEVTLAPIDQNGSARLITQTDLLSNVSDIDGPSLTANGLAISSGLGTLVDNHNGTWSYTPAPNDPSQVSFSYQVTDGVAPSLSDSATLDIIGNQPHPPPLLTFTGTPGDNSFDASPGNTRIDAQGGHDSITFDFRLVDAAVSFIGNQVIVDGPAGSHTVLTGFETYVFTDGTVNDDDGNPLVDDLYYYSQYHDVWNAHLDADTNFNTVGWLQGRNPDAFFNTLIYLSANPDVKAAGVNPLTHYDIFGWKEGRDPSIVFDTDAYLKAYPDVAAANVDPLAHFLAFGGQEGRMPFAPTSIVGANGFDYVYYLQHNADVAAANVDPLLHFEVFGWKEGRNPNAYFDTDGYLANYPDVAAAGVNPLDHYHIFGWHEGRDPSVGFDTTSYLAAYPDVAAGNVDPLAHFLRYGIAEGRQPFADGIWG